MLIVKDVHLKYAELINHYVKKVLIFYRKNWHFLFFVQNFQSFMNI